MRIASNRELLDYCREVIVNFEEKELDALSVMEERNCSLQSAHHELYTSMDEAIRQYCEDNGLNPADYEPEDVYLLGDLEPLEL